MSDVHERRMDLCSGVLCVWGFCFCLFMRGDSACLRASVFGNGGFSFGNRVYACLLFLCQLARGWGGGGGCCFCFYFCFKFCSFCFRGRFHSHCHVGRRGGSRLTTLNFLSQLNGSLCLIISWKRGSSNGPRTPPLLFVCRLFLFSFYVCLFWGCFFLYYYYYYC